MMRRLPDLFGPVIGPALALALVSGCADDVPEEAEVTSLINESMTEVSDGLIAAGVSPSNAENTVRRFTDCVYGRIRDDEDQLRAIAEADEADRLDVIERATGECQQVIIDAIAPVGG